MHAPSLGVQAAGHFALHSLSLIIPHTGWNRTLVRQLARTRNHTVRIKARVRARGVTGQQYFNERRTELCRAKARTQQIWSLQLAGDWFPAYETKVPALRPHYMRVMLTANLAVQDRMANGTVLVNENAEYGPSTCILCVVHCLPSLRYTRPIAPVAARSRCKGQEGAPCQPS